MTEAPAKKQRVDGRESSSAHKRGATYAVPGLQLTDHSLTVPLDHTGMVPGTIEVFFRELVHRNKKDDRALPYLLYLQGGPGYEATRPVELSGWIKAAANYFRIVLLDQRGTGRSTPITCDNLAARGGAAAQAAYLRHFRADSIVRDAELVRQALVPRNNHEGRWSLLGQSFGGFCCVTYLSLAPDGLMEVLITGGIPPGIDMPCSAETVYRHLAKRVLAQNAKFYQRFPEDVGRVQAIVRHLAAQPGGHVLSPAGNRITPRSFQLLGLSSLGFSHGLERLHYLVEGAWDGDRLSLRFRKDFDAWLSFDTNPLYALLHEAIYCQGAASNWAAQRVRESPELDAEFDAVARAEAGLPVNFTGEMIFPWMFEELAELRKVVAAAELLAGVADWPRLYDAAALRECGVPVAAATYYEDMFVDFNLAQQTAAHIKGIRQFISNEWLHCGIREAGGTIFDKLLNLTRGGTLLR